MSYLQKTRDTKIRLPLLTVPSKRALALKLGFSRQAVCQWARLPGAPGTLFDGSEDVYAWRAFVKARGLGSGNLSKSPRRLAAITRRHQLQADRMRFDLDAKRALYVSRAQAASALETAHAEAMRIFRKHLAGVANAELVIAVAFAELRAVAAGYK